MAEKTAKQLYEEQQKRAAAAREERRARLGKLRPESRALGAVIDLAGIKAIAKNLSPEDRGALHREIAANIDRIVGV